MDKKKTQAIKVSRTPRALIGLFILPIIFLVILWPFFNQPKIEKTEKVRPSYQIKLPEGWVSQKSSEPNALFAAKKKLASESDFASVVLIEETVKVADPNSYTYKLLMGAYKTIPSLIYTKDYRTQKPSLYLRDLEGKYSLSGEEAYLWQQILINDHVYVLTGSYSKPEYRPEIETVIQLVRETYSLSF